MGRYIDRETTTPRHALIYLGGVLVLCAGFTVWLLFFEGNLAGGAFFALLMAFGVVAMRFVWGRTLGRGVDRWPPTR